MKKYISYFLFFFIFNSFVLSQKISGSLYQTANKEIILEGFNGLNNYQISKTIVNEKGEFELTYSLKDSGIGYLKCEGENPFLVILSGENIKIQGAALNLSSNLNIIKGEQNKILNQYFQEQPKREKVLSAFNYLDKFYRSDPMFSVHRETKETIKNEINRLELEENSYFDNIEEESYVAWYLSYRKLLSSVSSIVDRGPDQISQTIDVFRNQDYSDNRLYKSGLLKDAVESHFWLIQNSGKFPDSAFVEMKFSIDLLLEGLIKNEKILNEVTDYLFDLLERYSLFRSSEYLALKVLNETSCTIDSNLARQLESYRAMKKGNIAPNIKFNKYSLLNGKFQTQFSGISDFTTPYTLVVFGTSTCPKCMEDIPKIVGNYVNWRNAGIEVLYVSLDTDPINFMSRVKDYPFFTYCDFDSWEGAVVQDYYVFGTPTYFLLDENRKIILKPNSVNQIDSWIKWVLKKQ
jgi:thiol-disulfide isomerase/thioredoxin